jgi:hypothetical protein
MMMHHSRTFVQNQAKKIAQKRPLVALVPRLRLGTDESQALPAGNHDAEPWNGGVTSKSASEGPGQTVALGPSLALQAFMTVKSVGTAFFPLPKKAASKRLNPKAHLR